LSKKSPLPDYIIILGTTESGASAVYQYLAGRTDITDPFKNDNYQLPHIPNGLMSLEAASESAFHNASADFALVQFESVLNKLSRSRTLWHSGKDYSKKIKFFENATKNFIKEITVANYPMHLEWHRIMRSSPQHIISLIKNFFGLREANISPPETRILASKEKIIKAAQKMHNKMFKSEKVNRPVVLDNAGSGWNPIESTKYFYNRKIILVTRDPRDQFVFIKKAKKGDSVDGFIDWYLEMVKRIKNVENNLLLKIKFEEFVTKHKEILDLICDHLLIDRTISSTYDPNLSFKNIGLYKKFLKKNEIDKIEKKLSGYIYLE
jgi:hypothetical protein